MLDSSFKEEEKKSFWEAFFKEKRKTELGITTVNNKYEILDYVLIV